jgi:hypothetical protein
MSQSAALYLNGVRSTKVTGEAKLVMNQSMTIREFWLDGVRKNAGTYHSTSGLVDSGGNALISGTGTLTVTGGTTTAAPFDDWADGFPSLTDSDPSLDFDGGSLPTGIEWVLGGNPTDASDDAAITPSLDHTSDPDGKLLFIFRRSAAAAADEATTIAVEYGGNLTSWTHAVHQGTAANQITITEQANGFGTGIDKVTVALPASLAGAGKLFTRLRVTVDAP